MLGKGVGGKKGERKESGREGERVQIMQALFPTPLGDGPKGGRREALPQASGRHHSTSWS